MSDCVDCQNDDGTCMWRGCQFPADYVMRSVEVTHKQLLIPIGDVDLCGGHHTRAQRLGLLNLEQDVIDRAAAARYL